MNAPYDKRTIDVAIQTIKSMREEWPESDDVRAANVALYYAIAALRKLEVAE